MQTKMMVLLKKKEGMPFEDFRHHYEDIHVPLCARWIGHFFEDFSRFYPQNLNNLYHGRADESSGTDTGTRYDAIAVYTIKDGALDDLVRVAQDPEFQRLISEDEELFCDRSATLEGSAIAFFGRGING